MSVPTEDKIISNDDLLVAVAEHIKMPLLHISQHLELARSGQDINIARIENITDIAMNLIDGYIFSRQLVPGQTSLDLEPVTVSSVLQDSANKLSKIAKDYSCKLELSLSGKYGPVVAHRQSVESAMIMLGYAFIEAQQDTESKNRRIVLAAHRNHHGITTGIYGHQKSLTSDMLKCANTLYGRAHRPLLAMGHSSGAGVFLADKLLNNIDSQLFVSRHRNLTGLAAIFTPSPQLKLV